MKICVPKDTLEKENIGWYFILIALLYFILFALNLFTSVFEDLLHFSYVFRSIG